MLNPGYLMLNYTFPSQFSFPIFDTKRPKHARDRPYLLPYLSPKRLIWSSRLRHDDGYSEESLRGVHINEMMQSFSTRLRMNPGKDAPDTTFSSAAGDMLGYPGLAYTLTLWKRSLGSSTAPLSLRSTRLALAEGVTTM